MRNSKVETALRGTTELTDHHKDDRERAPSEGQIVIVRPEVVENIGHVLGNYFQRIYHLVDQTRSGDAAVATRLESSTRALEDFLQLVIDYFSPMALDFQYVPGTEVAQSLARQISDTTECCVRLDVKLPMDVRVLADPGRLARAFGLLALQMMQMEAPEAPVELKVGARLAGPSAAFTLLMPRHATAPRSSEAEMQWAVAEKFLELHGGELHQTATPSGELLWEILLPLQS
jgi:hypothetical protein